MLSGYLTIRYRSDKRGIKQSYFSLQSQTNHLSECAATIVVSCAESNCFPKGPKRLRRLAQFSMHQYRVDDDLFFISQINLQNVSELG